MSKKEIFLLLLYYRNKKALINFFNLFYLIIIHSLLGCFTQIQAIIIADNLIFISSPSLISQSQCYDERSKYLLNIYSAHSRH